MMASRNGNCLSIVEFDDTPSRVDIFYVFIVGVTSEYNACTIFIEDEVLDNSQLVSNFNREVDCSTAICAVITCFSDTNVRSGLFYPIPLSFRNDIIRDKPPACPCVKDGFIPSCSSSRGVNFRIHFIVPSSYDEDGLGVK